MSNPKKNFVYNLAYQLLILICPLVTTPYLSRVIGSDGVGTYSYVYSIVYYFMLFTLLGVNNYGNRAIAKVRDNKFELSKRFWEIYFMQLFMGLIMLLLYYIYVFCFNIKYFSTSLFAGLFIVSAIFDINWLYFGLEEFKKTVVRNAIVKVLSVILIFIFIKNNNDICKYMVIMSVSTLLSQIIMWFFLKENINFEKIKFEDVVKHIKPNLILFIPVIAVSLYKMMDKVMLGALTNVNEVGFYENAEKIVNIPMIFITALGTVMLPRISNIAEKGDIENVKKYIDKSITFASFISMVMCCGLICISDIFAPWFFGNEFEKTGLLIILLSITLPFLSFANVIRTQYLIPLEKDKVFVKSVVVGAIINFLFNLILIKKFESIGACIGTIAAEISVMFYQSVAIRKELPILDYLKKSSPFLIKAVIMLFVIYPIKYLNMNSVVTIFIQVIMGGLIYLILNMKYIFENVNIKMLISKISIRKNSIIFHDIDNNGESDVYITHNKN